MRKSNRGASHLEGCLRWLTVILTTLLLTACECDCDKQPEPQPTMRSLVQFKTNSELGPWQEEVRLRDGRVIVIERFEAANVHTGMGDVGAAFITYTTIKFIAPAELAILPVLSLPYRPVVLDYDAERRVWFVIGVNDKGCILPMPVSYQLDQMDVSGRTNVHPNFEYRLVGGNFNQPLRWEEVEIKPDRLGLHANLLIQRTTVGEWMKKDRPMPLAAKKVADGPSAMPAKLREIAAIIPCR